MYSSKLIHITLNITDRKDHNELATQLCYKAGRFKAARECITRYYCFCIVNGPAEQPRQARQREHNAPLISPTTLYYTSVTRYKANRPTGRYNKAIDTELVLRKREMYSVQTKSVMQVETSCKKAEICNPISIYQCKMKYMHNTSMVISTRANYAVIMVIITTQISCPLKPCRLFRLVPGKTGRSRESSRTQKMQRYNRAPHPTSHKPIDNYVLNYGNVVISTRDVFAVNTAKQEMKLSCFPYLVRLFVLLRNVTRVSIAQHRTVTSHSNMKVTSYMTQSGSYNYSRNYHNVEISTRDVFAVSRLITDNPNKVNTIKSMISRYCKLNNKNDAAGRQNVRGATITWSLQKSRKRKRDLTGWQTYYMYSVRPTEQRQYKRVISIWLLRLYARVTKAHSNKIKGDNNCSDNYGNNHYKQKFDCITNMYDYAHYKWVSDKELAELMKYAFDSNNLQCITHERYWVKNMMVTIIHLPLSYKLSNFKQQYLTIITKTTKVVTVKLVKMENHGNNREVQCAVDHIPGPSHNCAELRALDDFISTQTSGTSARAPDPTNSVEGQNPTQATSAATERYEYDPINDCMKAIKTTVPLGVGKGKQAEPTSTGKLVETKIRHVIENYEKPH